MVRSWDLNLGGFALKSIFLATTLYWLYLKLKSHSNTLLYPVSLIKISWILSVYAIYCDFQRCSASCNKNAPNSVGTDSDWCALRLLPNFHYYKNISKLWVNLNIILFPKFQIEIFKNLFFCFLLLLSYLMHLNFLNLFFWRIIDL